MKPRGRRPQLPPTVTPAVEPPLSPHRAFVVQFRTPPATVSEYFTGRVEHIVSGRAARFCSPEELLATLRRMLADMAMNDGQQ